MTINPEDRWFPKRPYDEHYIVLHYAGRLPPSTTLDDVTVVAYDHSTGLVDASVIGAFEVDGSDAKLWVQGGVSGRTYSLLFRADLLPAGKLEDPVLMVVV